MTLQEAIQHLQETLADNNHEWGCEECKKEHEQLLEWLKELKAYKLKWEYKTIIKEPKFTMKMGQCNQCKYYEGVHCVQGHAPCSFLNINVFGDDHCSHFRRLSNNNKERI